MKAILLFLAAALIWVVIFGVMAAFLAVLLLAFMAAPSFWGAFWLLLSGLCVLHLVTRK